jgi:4-aminobutyrate aminotransferase-like enzyme
LVEDAKKTPATPKAESAKAACLKAGLLLGVGGVYSNVLRLQPPLVITQAQLDRALEILEKALREVSA